MSYTPLQNKKYGKCSGGLSLGLKHIVEALNVDMKI